MKKIIYVTILFPMLLNTGAVTAQQSVKEKIEKEGTLTTTNEKKFHWGVSLQQYFSGITGETQSSYFIKPSIGGGLRAEYYFNDWLGIGLGAAFQQRGAGVNQTDVTGGAYSHPWNFVNTPEGYRSGDLDSTHLDRLRFSTIEFPLTVLLRTSKDFLQHGMRLSGAVGPSWIHTSRVNQTYQSVIDGQHPYNWVTDNYVRNNLGLQASIGLDIDSGGGTSLFQLHFVYTSTLSNMYANGLADGRLVTYGVRFAFMF
jgi:hypothetical protein